MKIIDNYFDTNLVADITKTILRSDFPWYYLPAVADKNEVESLHNFYYVHSVYSKFKPNSQLFEDFFLPIIEQLGVKSLIRIKINMYPKTDVVYEHGEHIDYDFKHNGCVLYLNNCDGYTKIGKSIVNSVENRVVLFDPSLPHNSSTCTTNRFRLTVNFNYF